MAKQKRIAVLSGAGISAESGISTFRDKDGLWEGHDVMAVASPEGWAKDMSLVLDFYNQRRRELLTVMPNSAHKAIAQLEDKFHVDIVTQNVDNLHEAAGSTRVLHLHGELLKVRSTLDKTLIYKWTEDLNEGDLCDKGAQLRPHIVWFGEDVPLLRRAAEIVYDSDIVLIIGTSLQVYPAASLFTYARSHAKVYYIDPKPFISPELKVKKHEVIKEKATKGMKILTEILLNNTAE